MQVLEKYIATICAFSLSALCLTGLALSLNPKFAFSATGFALLGYSFLPRNKGFSNISVSAESSGERKSQNSNHLLVMQVLALFCLGAGQVGIFDNVS